MVGEKINLLLKTAADFGVIARQVNESSRIRRRHAERALELLREAERLGEGLLPGFEKVSMMNAELRNRNAVALAICEGLALNCAWQHKALALLENGAARTPGWSVRARVLVHELDAALGEAIPLLRDIIARDNRVCFRERSLIERKKMQLQMLGGLRLLTETSLADAVKAVEGSAANLERGLRLTERILRIPDQIEACAKGELNDILNETRRGWTTAAEVNTSSRGQLEFAEKVRLFATRLHHDTEQLIGSVRDKHREFEEAIQAVTVLTVVLAMKFPKYLELETTLTGIDRSWEAEPVTDFFACVHLACEDIRILTGMNNDMADETRMNNEQEDRTLRNAEREMACIDEVMRAVDAMTDAVAYPIEGSAHNIENGKTMEEHMIWIIAGL